MCLKGDMSSLELLFSNQHDLGSNSWLNILNNRDSFFHREAIKKMIAYARSQIRVDFDAYKRMEDAYPISYQNICKSSSHAIRMCEECFQLHTYGEITFPRDNSDFLKKVKTGKVSHNDITETLKEKISQLEKVVETSLYPEKPDVEKVDHLIYEIYQNEVMDERAKERSN